jgi:hypothetical protein
MGQLTVLTILFSLISSLASAGDRASEARERRDPSPKSQVRQFCDGLRAMDSAQLDQAFANGDGTVAPRGDTLGCVIGIPGDPSQNVLNTPLAALMNLLWTGKKFNADGTKLVNKIVGLKLATAEVGPMESVIDGKPVIVLDYTNSRRNVPGTARLIRSIRDEIRQVAPGIYLGRVLLKKLVADDQGDYVDPGFYFAVFTKN